MIQQHFFTSQEEWKAARCGLFTASEIKRLMPPGKRKMNDHELSLRPKSGTGAHAKYIEDPEALSDGALTYIYEKAAKLEAELKAKAEAEALAKRQQEEKEEADRKAKALAEKKAKAAPDKVKLAELSKAIAAIQMPAVKSEEALQIIKDAQHLLSKVVTHINVKSEEL